MPNVKVYNLKGAEVGELALADDVFGAEINTVAMHTVVRAYLNAQRQGTQSALTRTEVRGGGRKWYRQKGTGNARHHGRRAPQFKHGGVVFAPKPRSYRMDVPRRIRRLAMKSALSSKVLSAEFVVVDSLALEEIKTRAVAGAMKALDAGRKTLIVSADVDEALLRASGNIPNVKVTFSGSLNVYDILNCDKLIIAQDAVKRVEEVYAE